MLHQSTLKFYVYLFLPVFIKRGFDLLVICIFVCIWAYPLSALFETYYKKRHIKEGRRNTFTSLTSLLLQPQATQNREKSSAWGKESKVIKSIFYYQPHPHQTKYQAAIAPPSRPV